MFVRGEHMGQQVEKHANEINTVVHFGERIRVAQLALEFSSVPESWRTGRTKRVGSGDELGTECAFSRAVVQPLKQQIAVPLPDQQIASLAEIEGAGPPLEQAEAGVRGEERAELRCLALRPAQEMMFIISN